MNQLLRWLKLSPVQFSRGLVGQNLDRKCLPEVDAITSSQSMPATACHVNNPSPADPTVPPPPEFCKWLQRSFTLCSAQTITQRNPPVSFDSRPPRGYIKIPRGLAAMRLQGAEVYGCYPPPRCGSRGVWPSGAAWPKSRASTQGPCYRGFPSALPVLANRLRVVPMRAPVMRLNAACRAA